MNNKIPAQYLNGYNKLKTQLIEDKPIQKEEDYEVYQVKDSDELKTFISGLYGGHNVNYSKNEFWNHVNEEESEHAEQRTIAYSEKIADKCQNIEIRLEHLEQVLCKLIANLEKKIEKIGNMIEEVDKKIEGKKLINKIFQRKKPNH